MKARLNQKRRKKIENILEAESLKEAHEEPEAAESANTIVASIERKENCDKTGGKDNSLVSYLAFVASLIESREVSESEIIELREEMRQRGIASADQLMQIWGQSKNAPP